MSDMQELERAMAMLQHDNFIAARNFRELFNRTSVDDIENRFKYAELMDEAEQAIDRVDNLALMQKGCYQAQAREIIESIMGGVL